MSEQKQTISIVIAPECTNSETAQRIQSIFCTKAPQNSELTLRLDTEGLALVSDGQVLMGDFTRMLPRLKSGLSKELLVRAAKIKDPAESLTAVDATAGLGEDSLLLAAAGFHVTLYERNPIIYELLLDTVTRASNIPDLADIVARMQVVHGDSMDAMKQMATAPDVILLDPMFPERQKSALVKKKLQMIQKLEFPCLDESELILSAMGANPKKLIVKRPPKGPYLAGLKPDFSIAGKAVRFDGFASPYGRIPKFQKIIETNI